MKKISILIIALIAVVDLYGTTPTREMRSTWLTTVWGIDWPKTQISNTSSTTQINAQKAELTAILDTMKACGFNAVFFQIRGMSDVMYPSKYENWCQYLTGTRGKNPGYNPLQFAIEEAHARGMELHAWLNPYRYSSNNTNYGTLSNDYSITHPEWLLNYGNYSCILNPGLPEVRERIKAIIGEIINDYDVDGIVFDDYFYAYGGTSTTLDSATQRVYKPAGQSIGDWRRENVNKMIKAVYDTIQAIKPYVKFGVSPFGTWTTNESVAQARGLSLPQGVGTTGNMYEEIYCDPIAWLEEGTVDYISPQLYWTSTSSYPFGILSNWWSQISSLFGRHFYASHSTSSLTGAPAATKQVILRGDTINTIALSTVERSSIIAMSDEIRNSETGLKKTNKPSKAVSFAPSEIEIQIGFNRQYDVNGGPGSIFYNTTNTLKYASMRNIFKNTTYKDKAITPHINWKSTEIPTPPSNITLNGNILTWQRTDSLYRTAIYIVPSGKTIDSEALTATYLYDFKYGTTCTITANTGDVILLTSVDRYGAESAPKSITYGNTTENGTTSASAPVLIYPYNNSEALTPCNLRWNRSNNAIRYEVLFSDDNTFSNIIFNKQTGDTTFNTSYEHTIKDGVTYYWRVRSIALGTVSDYSNTYSFTAKKFGINTPTNGASEVSTECTIEWDSISATSLYTLQISTAVKFNTQTIVYEAQSSNPRHTIPEGILKSGYTYFAQVTVDDGATTASSDIISFTTEVIEIPVPQITYPSKGEIITTDNITIRWQEQKSNGFRVELSQDSTFPARQTKGKSTNGTTYEYTYEGLQAGVWYVRIKAANHSGYTEYSDTVSFTIELPVSNEEITEEEIITVQKEKNTVEIYSNFNTLEDVKISIFSITGIEIESKIICPNVPNECIILNISNLPDGVYILKIATKSEEKICRIKK